MPHLRAFMLATALAVSLSGCVFAPPLHSTATAADVTKTGEQAVATCGAGNVKEVKPKSFSCK
ncbi:MAG: hypothetical protein EOP73_28990, partial [Variovorax sp.]